MKTRIIHTKLWDDDFFQALTLAQKALFIYLMTNSLIGLTGIYELSDRRIRFDTGIHQDELEIAKQQFENAGKVAFKEGWVYVVNSQKYGGYTSEALVKPIQRELDLIPTNILNHFKDYAFNHSVPIVSLDSLGGAINNKSEIINNKPEIKKEEINKEEKGYEQFQLERERLGLTKRMN